MTETNVTQLKGNRKDVSGSKKEDKSSDAPDNSETPPKPKMSAGSVETFIIDFLQLGKIHPFMPKMKYEKWKIWFDHNTNNGTVRIYKIEEIYKECFKVREIFKSQLVAEINRHCRVFAGEDEITGKFCLTQKQAQSVAEKMMGETVGRSIEELPIPFKPKVCGFKSEKGYIFNRTNFDPNLSANKSQFPLLAKYFDNIVNGSALCLKMISIHDPKADRKQFVTLYGPGDGGKSTAFKTLTALAGGEGATAPVDDNVFSNRFALRMLLNKRVWLASELSSEHYAKDTSLIKRLTGGDLLPIEGKGENQFGAHLDGILFVNSNDQPLISSDTGMLNRILIFRAPQIHKDDRIPEDELMEIIHRELPYFAGYWLRRYRRGRVELEDQSEIESSISDYEAPYARLFDSLFIHDVLSQGGDDRTLRSSEFEAIWVRLENDQPGVVRNLKKEEFQNYIKRRTGRDGYAFSKQVKKHGKKDRYIIGVRKK
jgi:hypothetical protein